MLGVRRRPKVESERMTLRLPQHPDWRAWASLREISAAHLTPWEPVWAHDHLSRRAFIQGGVGATIALPFLDAMVPAQTPLAMRIASCKGSSQPKILPVSAALQ